MIHSAWCIRSMGRLTTGISREQGRGRSSAKNVRFTGTSLKMVRYAGGDGARLAPLVVGDRSPVAVIARANPTGTGESGKSYSGGALGPGYWAIALAALAVCAMLFARWHLRVPMRTAGGRRSPGSGIEDPPLEFVEPGGET